MHVDAHVHVFPPSFTARRQELAQRDVTFQALYANPKAKLGSVDELLASMDRNRIQMAVLANIGWATAELCRETNDHLLEAAQAHPTRFVALCSVNPRLGEVAVEEFQRSLVLGAHGLGELHPDPQGFALGDLAVMRDLMALAEAYQVPVLTHSSEPVGHSYDGKGNVTPASLTSFVTNFPKVRIICAHWGGGLPFYALMPEVRAALANVWFDSAVSPLLYEAAVFERVADLVGVEKILFGSDFPLVRHERLLQQVSDAKLSSEAKERILGRNAASLFGLK